MCVFVHVFVCVCSIHQQPLDPDYPVRSNWQLKGEEVDGKFKAVTHGNKVNVMYLTEMDSFTALPIIIEYLKCKLIDHLE